MGALRVVIPDRQYHANHQNSHHAGQAVQQSGNCELKSIGFALNQPTQPTNGKIDHAL
jgi:hypothetical protein